MSLLSKQDVDQVVVKSGYKSSEIVKYREEVYSEETNGFLGYHGRLIVNLSSETELSFFVKKMPQGNSMISDFIKKSGIFLAEVRFYDEILPVLQCGLRAKNRQKLAPHVYLTKQDLIVMEDLKSLGYMMKKVPLDLAHVKATLAILARFHGATILAEEQLGKTMPELFPGAFNERILFNKSVNFFDPGVDAIAGAAEKLGLARFQTIYDICQKLKSLIKPSEKHRNVISQADTWAYNLLFRPGESGGFECVLVDYQLIRYVPMVLDVVQCMYINLEGAQRRTHERDLLNFYWKELGRFARENECKGIPSFREILDAYEDTRLYGAIYAGLLLPVALMETEIKENEIKDVEGFNNFAFRDRSRVIFQCMDEHETYRLMVREAVLYILEAEEMAKKLKK